MLDTPQDLSYQRDHSEYKLCVLFRFFLLVNTIDLLMGFSAIAKSKSDIKFKIIIPFSDEGIPYHIIRNNI